MPPTDSPTLTSAVRLTSTATRRLLFLVPTALQAVISLLSIPIIIAAVGPDIWVDIAAGQALGGIAAVVATLGWDISGPARVAMGEREERLRTLATSITTKVLVSIPLLLILAIADVLIARHSPMLAVLGSMMMLAQAFSATWYFAGTDDPVGLLLLDTLPRIGTTYLGWGLVLVGLPVAVGLGVHAAAAAVGISTVSVVMLRNGLARVSELFTFDTLLREFRTLRHGVSTQTVVALFAYSPTILASVFAPGAAPLVATVDKVQKQLLTGLGPVGNILVSRVSAQLSQGVAAPAAARTGLRSTVSIGLLFGVFAALAGIPLVWLLSAGTFIPDLGMTLLLGASVGASFIAVWLPAASLAVLNSLDAASRSATLGASIGLVLASTLTALLGGHGSIAGMALGYAAIGALGARVAKAHISMAAPPRAEDGT